MPHFLGDAVDGLLTGPATALREFRVLRQHQDARQDDGRQVVCDIAFFAQPAGGEPASFGSSLTPRTRMIPFFLGYMTPMKLRLFSGFSQLLMVH